MDSILSKRYCIAKISVCFVLLCTLSITLYYLYKSNFYITQHNFHVAGKIQELSFEIMDVHKHEAMLNNSGTLWQEISTSNIYSNVYEENLGMLISDFCKKYYLFNSQISISSPKMVNDIYNKQHIDITQRHIEIKFASISDEQVFLFINAIRHDISGYVKVISFNIEKNTDITDEVLQSALKGDPFPVVSGSISFDLYSIVARFIDES